jgi:NADH-quinone oxidoreductase subunit G
MKKEIIVEIDNAKLVIKEGKSVLDAARAAGIDIPTFCHHSELSVYGACRMCMVDIEGRGIVASCSTHVEDGMKVKTNTPEIREIRKMNLELLLAAHDRECTTCGKSGSCSLQRLSKSMGVEKIRFKKIKKASVTDTSSCSIVRNPAKCILCGDCVRFCDEIQGIGAIDFAHRGSAAVVGPAFGKDLADVDCVNCGQCARVCPTGALTVKNDLAGVWKDIDDKKKIVVAQVAPAIRVALGEYFGMTEGGISTGKIATALKMLGFDHVYDTCFSADATVLEEGAEFLGRVKDGGVLPLFTSCCPAWVTFAEQYYPELLGNLSTCKSPQQMFGSMAKRFLPEILKVSPENLTVVSIMPCTAKKFEAKRPEFSDGSGIKEIDWVITSQELGAMIESAGLRFRDIKEGAFDDPFGVGSGAGTIFGTSGGVTEAVVRHAHSITGGGGDVISEKKEGAKGIIEIKTIIAGIEIRAAVVYGLRNAKMLCEDVKNGKNTYHIIEIMACPGGCVNGAGQPVTYDFDTVRRRGRSLYEIDRNSNVKSSNDNTSLLNFYEKYLGAVGGEDAHHLLHTGYSHRRRIKTENVTLGNLKENAPVSVEVCIGTNCCLHGSHDLIREALNHVDEKGFRDDVSVKAAFCFERCSESPVARIAGEIVGGCSASELKTRIDTAVAALKKTEA